MKNKGFTLIELLAVIVILAIIALIAVPIILGIIIDERESARQRSMELYVSAVRNAITTYRLNNGKSAGNFNQLTIDYEGDVECETKILHENETFTIADCKVEGKKVNYEYGIDNIKKICNGTNLTLGSKYSCELGDGITRDFYVLEVGANPVTDSSLAANEVALIMGKNYDNSTQSWCNINGKNANSNLCNADGLTEKLNEIRNSWPNIKSEQIVLPTYNQIYVANNVGSPWLFFELNDYKFTSEAPPYGYWTSTPVKNNAERAWIIIGTYNEFTDYPVNVTNSIGVRPVIIVSKYQLG